jgi:hypothetical protein
MPQVEFESLPPNARLWVFGAGTPLDALAEAQLLNAVDEHLAQWRAHGAPLVCARDWRDNRFVAVAVDEAATGASGCSIDGLFRTLTALQQTVGTTLVGGGTLFWRASDGSVQSGNRTAFADAVAGNTISASTPVFDLTVATVGDWRANFERPTATSWHARLLNTPPTP